jgi:phosphoglycolate phosphatase
VTGITDVIFDLDGTLVDSLPGVTWSVKFALAVCGVDVRCPDLKPLMGPPIREILAAASGITDPPLLDRLEAAFRASYDEQGWCMAASYDGAVEMIRQLRASGLRLWMATNKNRLPAEKILRNLELNSFQEVVCRDSRVPPFRSKGEMLRDLLVRHELSAADCLMVGDTQEDWRAAVEAGIACVLVPHGYGTPPVYPQRIEGWPELLDLCMPAAAARPSQGTRASRTGGRA